MKINCVVPPWLGEPCPTNPYKPLVVGGPKAGGDTPVIQRKPMNTIPVRKAAR